MYICNRCGTQLPDGIRFCTRCGNEIRSAQTGTPEGGSPLQGMPDNTAQQSQPYNTAQQGQPYGSLPSGQLPAVVPQSYPTVKRPILTNGQAAIVGYLGWTGFLVAMLAGDRKDPYARLHLSQALLMNITSTVAAIIYAVGYVNFVVGGILGTMFGGYGYYDRHIGGGAAAVLIGAALIIFTFVCWLIGLIRACRGMGKPVFFFGQLRLLK